MSGPFVDLNLSADQIAKNYTWKQIKNTQEYTESRIFDDLEKNLLVVSNRDNILDQSLPGLTDNVILGTSIGVTGCQSTVSVGHHFDLLNSSDIIKIGGAEELAENDDITNCNRCLSIGYNNTISNAGDSLSVGFDNSTIGNLNICLGCSNDINGTNNILIGHDIFLTHSGMTGNTIISTGPLPGTAPADGSIILGGSSNSTSASDARLQILSNNLVPAGSTGAWGAQYEATIPIRYRGVNYRIPVLPDP